MNVTNIIQHVGNNYVEASKHYLASIAEIIDTKTKVITLTSIIDQIQSHMDTINKVPGKELVNSNKYNGTYGDVYLITQSELEGIARLINKVSELVPVHHTNTLAPILASIQQGISEIKKD